ncbi:MAG: sporulation protein YqfC [Firmicutes bacterium]|nr:sporulation protein YqfC [Bacillota bacterium]
MWQRIAVGWLGLPADVVLDVPHIVWVGHLQVAVANHRGLVLYSPSRVVIASSLGPVRVEGRDLAVRRVGADSVEVVGHVRTVRVGA